MALPLRPRIDFGSRAAALRAVGEDLGLPANQILAQNASNSSRTYLKFINFCRTALALPLYVSLDYGAFTSAINAISTAAGTAKAENVTNPFVGSNVNPPTTGSVLTTTNGTWLNAGGAAYSYQWKRNGVNIGTNIATYTVLVGDTTHSYAFTCDVTATTGAGASTPATSNPIVVP